MSLDEIELIEKYRARKEAGNKLPPVLDPCCAARMMWFNKKDERGIFVDKRSETHVLTDRTRKPGSRILKIEPDYQADFTELPFQDDSFFLVVFDPPHLVRAGNNSWLAKKYGKLEGNWQEEIRQGFAECFKTAKTHWIVFIK